MNNRFKNILFLLLCILTAGIIFAGTHDPWDGTVWDVTSPDIDQLAGNHYKELYDLRKGVALRMNKEHETLATSSAGGVHKQGSARAFFQDAAPTTQVNGDAFDSGDLGSFWFDTNSSPDNLFYVLTAVTPTWTLVSTSMTAEIVAAAHSWADVQTFDLQTVHTLGILSNGAITLGAGDDLIGSATSDITINTDKFTVDGATGNTVVAGTLGVTGVTTLGTIADGAVATTQSVDDGSTKLATTAYVEAQVDNDIPTSGFFSYSLAHGSNPIFNSSATAANTYQDLDLSAIIGSNNALVYLKVKISSSAVQVKFKTKGETDGLAYTGKQVEPAGVSIGQCATANYFVYLMVVSDSNGEVQWLCDNNSSTITISVVGYVN